MKAMIIRQFGGPEQLHLADVADPVPGRGQVRVAVHAAGVNPVDPFNRADGSWAGLRVPCILGYDIAGVVGRTAEGGLMTTDGLFDDEAIWKPILERGFGAVDMEAAGVAEVCEDAGVAPMPSTTE